MHGGDGDADGEQDIQERKGDMRTVRSCPAFRRRARVQM